MEQAELEPRSKKKSGSVAINKSNSFVTMRSSSSRQITPKKSPKDATQGFLYQVNNSERVFTSTSPTSSSGKLSKYDELSQKAQKILVEFKKSLSSTSNEEMDLDLSDSGISSIPAFYFDDLPVEALTCVTKLNLASNKISITTPLSKYFKYLHSLDMSRNNISYIDVGSLDNLTWLNISRNSIKSISKELAKLVNIRYLDISFNQLSFLSSSMSSSSEKEDSSDSSRLFSLCNLTYLNISNNPLSVLPSSIGKLDLLKYLNASNCELSDLPDEILSLSRLEDLLLSDNDIVELPANLDKLSNLKNLDITGNNIHDLPVSIGKCSQLEDIKLEEKAKDMNSNLLLQYRRGFDNFFAFLKSRAEGTCYCFFKLFTI